jgi:hypothetical protein
MKLAIILLILTIATISAKRVERREHVETKTKGEKCQWKNPIFNKSECEKSLSCKKDQEGSYRCLEADYKGPKKAAGVRCVWRFFESECDTGLKCTRKEEEVNTTCQAPKEEDRKVDKLKKQAGEECTKGMLIGSDCDSGLKCEEVSPGSYICQKKIKGFGERCKTRALPEFFGKDCEDGFSCLEGNVALKASKLAAGETQDKEKSQTLYYCLVPKGKSCSSHSNCGGSMMCDKNCKCYGNEAGLDLSKEQCVQTTEVTNERRSEKLENGRENGRERKVGKN